MALTKIGKEGITGISNSADATFLTATSSEGVTLAGTLAVTGVHTVGTNAVATSDGGAVTTSVVQGLAKAFHGFTDQSSGSFPSGVASHNISSYNDVATGRSRLNMSNAMANTNQSVHGSCTAYDYGHFMATTLIYEIGAVNSSGNFADAATFGAILGDLA